MNDKKYFTKERLDKLKNELQDLKTTKAKEIAKRLKKAASFGDISDNAEYDEAKEAQTFLISKIAELDNLIKNAEVIEKEKKSGRVQISSRVVISSNNKEETFQIVGAEEADPLKGMISYQSPLGKALLNKSTGSKAEFEAPNGKIIYKIIKIN